MLCVEYLTRTIRDLFTSSVSCVSTDCLNFVARLQAWNKLLATNNNLDSVIRFGTGSFPTGLMCS